MSNKQKKKKKKKKLRLLINSVYDPRVGVVPAGDAIVGGIGGGLGAALFQISWVLGVLFLVLGLGFLFVGHKIRKLKVLKNDYFMCPWCGYGLGQSNAAPIGKCSKCQSRYVKTNSVNLYHSKYDWFWLKTKRTRIQEKYLWARALREKNRV